MIDTLEKPLHQLERHGLQNELAAIDRDPDKLRTFIADMYTGTSDNPHIMYAAATHLTSLTYLDRRDTEGRPVRPDQQDARRAFTAYTHLLSMLAHEMDAPVYSDNERIRKRLVGAREELDFHAVLAYASAQGADFVALPSPSELDFTGADEASDVQIFFPETTKPPLEIQVTLRPDDKADKGYTYHPRIPVLGLASALGDTTKAAEVRGMLRDIGDRDNRPNGKLKLPRREHATLLDASASILLAAQNWNKT